MMDKKINLLFFIMLFFTSSLQAQSGAWHTALFDDDWRFYRGDSKGAEQPAFDDAQWRMVDLPHDWSIEDLPGTQSPFDSAAISGVSGGFTTGGTGWYRKTFNWPAQQPQPVYLQFDGVYMNATVWVNGVELGSHPYGYTSFWYNIGALLKPGKNVVAVQVRNEGRNSRWYSGSGIYRHVWLRTASPVHIAQWGTVVTTPVVNKTAATVQVATQLRNETSLQAAVEVALHILDSKGAEVGSARSSGQVIAANDSLVYNRSITIQTPRLWSVDDPALYTLVAEVYKDGQLADRYTTAFGIRTISFDAVNGFRLNGASLKLKGGCVHHDNGPLGAKAFDRAEERKIQLLKAAGYNAIRCAHNPPSPALLDACDRLGMLVIDEAFDTWKDGKNKQDYHLYFNDWWQRDIQSMVLRDRNHPSIILWSTGNEIPHREKPEVAAIAKELSSYVHQLDSTRPVTAGVNGIAPDKDAFLAALDVAGYNYARDHYESDHARVPGRVMFASESFALDAFDYWQSVLNHPWVVGDFVWTAFDYIGEASIGWLGYPQSKQFYPWNLAYCGDIDVCGFKRPQSFYRDALWKKNALAVVVVPPQPSFAQTNPRLESWSRWNWADVVADWNWPGHEQQPLTVNVYSSCEQAELFINGRSLGKQTTDTTNRFIANWQVPYEAGELKAVGYAHGKIVQTTLLRSAGTPDRIALQADRTKLQANGQDLSYITVELTDAKGIRHPKADSLVHFSIEGPGTIVAVGNANPTSTESCRLPQRKAWQGRCLVIVQAGKKAGDIVLKASAAGMREARIRLQSR